MKRLFSHSRFCTPMIAHERPRMWIAAIATILAAIDWSGQSFLSPPVNQPPGREQIDQIAKRVRTRMLTWI